MEISEKDEKHYAIFFILLGLVLVTFTLTHGPYMVYIHHTYEKTDALILNLREDICHRRQGGYSCDKIIVEIKSPAGITYKSAEFVNDYILENYKEGDHIPIMYNINDPVHTARTIQSPIINLMLYPFVFLVGSLILWGGIKWLQHRKKEQKNSNSTG